MSESFSEVLCPHPDCDGMMRVPNSAHSGVYVCKCGQKKVRLGFSSAPATPAEWVKIRAAGVELTISHQNIDGIQYCDYCAKEAREAQNRDEIQFIEAGRTSVSAKLENSQ